MNATEERVVATAGPARAGSYPTVEDHEKAFTEVSFFLEAFAATVGEIMGGATVSVGRSAGRGMARKLPVYLPSPTLELALEAVAARMRKACDMDFERGEDGETVIRFGRCAIREVCRTRSTPVGGELCRIFHYCMDGEICELACRPIRSHVAPDDESCTVRLETK